MSGATALRRTAAQITRRLCVAKERLTTTEWAVKYRELPETGGTRGRYRIETVPYHRRPQDLMGDPTVPLICLAWASQTGKSTCIENAIGKRIHLTPGPMLMVRPKIDDAESWAKERFDPMVRATRVLSALVRLGRAGQSTLRYKVFPGGYLFVPSAQSATELASRSAPDLFIDEADRMEVIAGEGNPIEIVQRRNAATDLGTTVITSTPRDEETTLIWPYLEDGTYELYELPCPHCAHMQPLVWGARERDTGLRWRHAEPWTAAYLCRSCQHTFEEREKPALLLAGDWRATQPEKEYPSFHLNGLYSPFAKSSWATLAREWEKAQGKPHNLQVFFNTRLAELWKEAADQVDESTLAGRLEEELEEGVVPDGVGVLTAGVDVQAAAGGRLEVAVWGWGAGLESWLVATAILPGDPDREPDSPGSVWQDLDAYLGRRFPHVNGGELPIAATLIDSGHATTKVYAFTRQRARRKIYACKGVGGEKVTPVGKPTPQGRWRVILYPLGVDALKTEFLRSQIHEQSPGPGYVHLGKWVGDGYLKQLVSEKRITRIVKGRAVREWRPLRADTATEGLDCRNYARAALDVLGPRVVRSLGTLAEGFSGPRAEVEDSEETPPTVPAETLAPKKTARLPKRRGGWIKSW